jgi:hypothetical protein
MPKARSFLVLEIQKHSKGLEWTTVRSGAGIDMI